MATFLGHTVYITLRFYEQNTKNLNKISLCKSSKLVVTFVILGSKVISNFTQVQFVVNVLWVFNIAIELNLWFVMEDLKHVFKRRAVELFVLKIHNKKKHFSAKKWGLYSIQFVTSQAIWPCKYVSEILNSLISRIFF